MRNINYPLLLGSIILIFLVVVAVYPAIFTTNDPLLEEAPKYIEYKKDGEWVETFGHNPMPPNKENILGTDDAGRDVYARLIYGTRNTLKLALLIAIFRMIVALPLGMMAGMGIRFFSNIIKVFNTFFTAIPMLLFSFVVLNIGYFRTLQMDKAIIAFAIVLTIVGWSKLAGMIEDTTRRVMAEDFIEGEIAIGKTKLQIAYQNVLPHIIPDSISLFFKEMAMGLFLIAQLAVLYIFVGVTRQIKELSFKANYDMILEPEWGGSLSRLTLNIKKYETVYWLTLYPVLAFSIAVAGINLLGEGLRIEFQKRDSRFISSIRRAYYLVSPKLFFSQVKDIKQYYKPVITKTLIITITMAYFLIPWHPSKYDFDIDYATKHLQELTDEKYQGRVSGTEGGYLAGEYIIDTLKEYGYQVETMDIPLTVEGPYGMIIPHDLAPLVIESGWIKLTNDAGEEKTYELHEDFSIGSISKSIVMGSEKGQLHYKGVAADPEKADNIPEGTDFFVIDRNRYFLNKDQMDIQNQIKIKQKIYEYDIRFILQEGLDKNTNTYLFKSTAIIPFEDLRADLENGYREVEIAFDYPQLPTKPVRNITAFLPGEEKTKEEPGELIIIGASYDGVHINGAEHPYALTATPVATALEVARKLSQLDEPLEKSVQFIFWDNEFDTAKHSDYDGSTYYGLIKGIPVEMAMSHKYFYLDIAYPNWDEDHPINLIAYPAQRPDKSSYLIGLEMEKRLKQMDVKYRRIFYNYPTTKGIAFMKLNALTTVGVGTSPRWVWGMNSSQDHFENINLEQIESIGQLILDTMTMNSYLME